MSAAAALKRSSYFYNTLVQTPSDQSEAVARLRWDLMKAEKDLRGDFSAGLFLAYGHLRAGAPEEAATVINRIHGNFRTQKMDTVIKHAAVLSNCLMWEKADEVLDWIFSTLGEGAAGHFMTREAAIETALGLGQMERLKALAPRFAAAVTNSGVAPFLDEYGAEVRRVLAGRTCFTLTDGIQDEGEDDILVVTHYVAADTVGAMELERQLDDSLNNLAERKGVAPSRWLTAFMTQVAPVTTLPILRDPT